MTRISYVLENSEYCKPGYVVLGLMPCTISDDESIKKVMRTFGLPVSEFKEVTSNG